MRRYYDSGNRYFAQQKYNEAIIQYGRALQVDPAFVDARYQMAQCHLRLGALANAYVELLHVLQLRPDHLPAHLDLGNLLLGGKNYEQAREEARFVLDRDAKNPGAHVLLANVLAATGDSAGGIREMQTAIDLSPGRADLYVNLGLLLASANRLPEAESSFQKALSLAPDSKLARLSLAEFYQNQKRYGEAEAQFRQEISEEPASPPLRLALAKVLVLQGRTQDAEQMLAAAKVDLKKDPNGYRLLADFYRLTDQPDKAMVELASLLQQHPKDLRVKKDYIELLIAQGHVADAEKLTDGILKDNPKDREALLSKGEVLNHNGRFRDAISTLAEVLNAAPEDPRAHFHDGVAYAGLGDMDRAESEWREAVRINPDLAEAQQALATVAIRKGDMDLLRQTADNLVRLRPKSPSGYILRAASEAARQQPAATEADLQKAIELAPSDALPYSRLAGWRVSQHRYVDAEKLYEQSLDRNPALTEALQGLVNLYIQQKQLPKAIQRVKVQLLKVPNSSDYYLMLGRLQVAARDPDSAEASFRKATQVGNENLEALLLLAQVQGSRHDLDGAIATYETATRKYPSDVRAYIQLGSLYEHRGDPARGAALYRKALQVDPDNPVASNNLAYLLLNTGGNIDVAISLAQVAHRRMPDSPSAADTLAWAYYKKGANALAIDLLEEAVHKAPDNPTFHYHLGLAYEQANNPERARVHLQKALQLNPQYDHGNEIQQVLKKLERG